jgi:ABC-type Fe3+/spermidine/putrescine transport system ATPase subunit
MALLEVDGVNKSYTAGVAAVHDVSIAVESGEILCLLGPSGCGKTTLLRLIAGLETPDRGEITFEGRNLAGVKPHERGFGLMFQDFALFPHRNVHDNVAFGLRMRGLPAAEIASRVSQMLALVDMSGFEERGIAGLSGGEQQRVALARALAPGPRLLMLDEPLGALDRALRERLIIDVRTVLKRIGMTAIYVTHDQTEAFAVSDRLVVMNAGRIEQVGLSQKVYARPATPFVARFLGFRNLVAGRVGEGGIVETDVGFFRPDAPLPSPGTTVTLLIKPNIAGIEEGPLREVGVNQIGGVIDEITFRGRFSQVWLAVGDHHLLFEESRDIALKPGDAAGIEVSAADLLVYESTL